jgi:hypothetical protein
VTATNVTMTSQLDAKELRAALKGLAPKVQQSVLKTGMRKALTPLRNELRSAWKAARFKGKDPHRQAIASATTVDVRRGGGGAKAPIVARVGVKYGHGGGAKANGRQKIWHLLEAGFSRFQKGENATKAYANYANKDERRGYQEFVKVNRSAIWQKVPKADRGKALRAMFADARSKFPTFVEERKARAERRKTATRSSVPGKWISKAVVQRSLRAYMERVRNACLAAAAQALGGKK